MTCIDNLGNCDDLVTFALLAGVKYLSFSKDTAPKRIVYRTYIGVATNYAQYARA